jgi:hypothetical protein
VQHLNKQAPSRHDVILIDAANQNERGCLLIGLPAAGDHQPVTPVYSRAVARTLSAPRTADGR